MGKRKKTGLQKYIPSRKRLAKDWVSAGLYGALVALGQKVVYPVLIGVLFATGEALRYVVASTTVRQTTSIGLTMLVAGLFGGFVMAPAILWLNRFYWQGRLEKAAQTANEFSRQAVEQSQKMIGERDEAIASVKLSLVTLQRVLDTVDTVEAHVDTLEEVLRRLTPPATDTEAHPSSAPESTNH